MFNLVGQTLGRYQLIEKLGEGGMAAVYKAYDPRLDRFVAVKVISSSIQQDASFSQRFDLEAKSLAKLSHPNIVQIYDYGEHDGIAFLVMAYVPGGTLKQRISGPMNYPDAAKLLIPIAKALEFAHQNQVIHRDIKPANILLTQSGEPMLSDFGIAKMLGEGHTLTGTGVGIGTPEYMSPEQCKGGKIDQRSDIYSLGIVFFELITGRRPYQADTPMAVAFKQVSEPLPRLQELVPGLPETVEKVIYKTLAKNPDDRYQKMSEFFAALEKLAQEEFPRQKIAKTVEVGITPIKKRINVRFILISTLGIMGLIASGIVLFGIKPGFIGKTAFAEASPTPQKPMLTATLAPSSVISTLAPTKTRMNISSEPRILFDELHNDISFDLERAKINNPDNPEFAYAGLFARGVSEKYVIDPLRDKDEILPEYLVDYRVLVLYGDVGLYTQNEADTILNFVRSGGGLFIVGAGKVGSIFLITEPLGIKLIGSPIASPDHLDWGPWGFIIPVNSTDEILRGVSSLTINASVAVEVSDETFVILWTDEDTWIDKDEDQIQDSIEKVGPFPMVIKMFYGEGRVVLFPMIPWGGFYYDNDTFILNSLDWLMGH
ncbi:MAG: protein kinase [Chloroflexota bacterium]